MKSENIKTKLDNHIPNLNTTELLVYVWAGMLFLSLIVTFEGQKVKLKVSDNYDNPGTKRVKTTEPLPTSQQN